MSFFGRRKSPEASPPPEEEMAWEIGKSPEETFREAGLEIGSKVPWPDNPEREIGIITHFTTQRADKETLPAAQIVRSGKEGYFSTLTLPEVLYFIKKAKGKKK